MKLKNKIFLSELIGRPVMDAGGEKIGKIVDFSVIRGQPLPIIKNLVVKTHGRKKILDWDEIEVLNRQFTLCRPTFDQSKLQESPVGQILAVKDIFDKQIVDTNGAKIVRVNDIEVRETDGKLSLTCVDVGMRGILRRLGLKRDNGPFWRWLVRKIPYDLISWRFIQSLEEEMGYLSLTVSKELVSLHPYEIADILTQIPPDNQESLIKSLGVDKVAEAIPEMEEKHQVALVERIDTDKAAEILEAMAPDDAADILGDMPEEQAEKIIEQMEDEEAEEVKELLQHEEDTAGGLMTTDYVTLKPETTVSAAMNHLRRVAAEIDNIYIMYIVDDAGHLLGFVCINDLFLKPVEATLSSFMSQRIKSVHPESNEREAAIIMAKYNMLSLPVVDRENKLVGIITFDDVLEVLIPSVKKRKRM